MAMKIDRLLPGVAEQGCCLTVAEKEPEGEAKLQINLDREGVLFRYPHDIHFVFANRKRADGILFVSGDEAAWDLCIVELKKTVKPKEWKKIKEQWHGAWLHALALSGVLEAPLSGKITFMAACREDRIAENSPNPVLLKRGGPDLEAYEEWQKGQALLRELGLVAFKKIDLDEEGMGTVSWTKEEPL